VNDDSEKCNVVRLFRGRAVHPSWPEELERAQRETEICIAGQVLPRIRYGEEGNGWGGARHPCHDCAAIKGELHVPGCDVERCPACRGQAISCGCADGEEPRSP
jgi:hypothetical protein